MLIEEESADKPYMDTEGVYDSFHELVQQDPQLSRIFGSLDELPIDTHGASALFQSKLKSNLLTLIEAVLVGSTQGLDEEAAISLVEQRLRELGNPRSHERAAQLQIVDSFLRNEQAKASLKEVIETVKPYFLMTIQDTVREEAERVLKAFHLEDTSSQALQLYLLNLHFPHFFKNAPFLKSQSTQAKVERALK